MMGLAGGGKRLTMRELCSGLDAIPELDEQTEICAGQDANQSR